MTLRMFGLGLALTLSFGCAADEMEDRGSESNLSGTAGTPAGPSEFGNSVGFVPPPPSTNLSVTGGGCKAGHYVGQLDGLYISPAAVGWTPTGVPISTNPDNIDAALLNMLFPPADGVGPGFEFWLEASEEVAPCGGDQEFCFDFKVEGGAAKGVANGLFPFSMELNGDLDCNQGHFEGLIENGMYEVAGIPFFFEGTITASYAADKAEFFDGEWVVTEPADPTAGGEGTWYTAWVEDTP